LRNDYAPGIRVEQNLRGIKPQSARWLRWSLHSVAVNLSREHLWHERVPVMVRAVRFRIDPNHALRSGVILPVEKQQLHACSTSGVQAEIDAAVTDRGSEGRASTDERGLRLDWFKHLVHCSHAPRFTPEDEGRSSTGR